MGEHRAQRVVRHLAEIAHARAERRRGRAGVAGRPAGAFHRGPHRRVDALGRRRVDQRHRALRHALRGQEGVVGPRQHIHDRIADAEKIESSVHEVRCQRGSPPLGQPARNVRPFHQPSRPA
jgi:hypothetical protein